MRFCMFDITYTKAIHKLKIQILFKSDCKVIYKNSGAVLI